MRHIQPLHEHVTRSTHATQVDARELYFQIIPTVTPAILGPGQEVLQPAQTGAPYILVCNIARQGEPPWHAKIGKWNNPGTARAMLKFYSRRLEDTVNALRGMYFSGDPDAFMALRDSATQLVKLPEPRRVSLEIICTVEIEDESSDDADIAAAVRTRGINIRPENVQVVYVLPPRIVPNDPTAQPRDDRTE